MQVGETDHWVRRGDPDGLELALFQGAEHLHGSQARLGADAAGGLFPGRFEFAAVLGVVHEAVAGELVREQAGLAAAHRVGLAGQRERPGADLADLPGEQVQVDEAVVLPGADGALAQAHAVEAQYGPGPADALGQAPQTSAAMPHSAHHRIRSPARRKSRYSSMPVVWAAMKSSSA